MQRNRLKVVTLVGLAIVGALLWLYSTHFFYDPGLYSIGVLNGTGDIPLRDVSIRLEPEGEFTFGVEEPGQAKWLQSTRWPVPTKISVSFNDPTGILRVVSTAGIPQQFRGQIRIVITKTNDYAVHVELKPR